jgi:SAM-dependent methyltransferase
VPGRQKDAFLASDGDAWYRRNHDKLALLREGGQDRVLTAIDALSLRPQRVLEIGCSDGWRLSLLCDRYACNGQGVDPSAAAIEAGRRRDPRLDLRRGTAEALPFEISAFDLVIFGFCLYLCDRDDLFRIAAEADRVLADPGHLAILDFCTNSPYRRVFAHAPGLFSYKLDYARLFTWNPHYTLVRQDVFGADDPAELADPDARIAVSVLRKQRSGAYPLLEPGPGDRGT